LHQLLGRPLKRFVKLLHHRPLLFLLLGVAFHNQFDAEVLAFFRAQLGGR